MRRRRLLVVAVLASGVVATLACGSSSDGPRGAASDAGSGDIDGTAIFEAGIDASADASSCSNLPGETLVDPASTTLLTIAGEPGSSFGIYDPSLVYPKGAPGGVLSYSTVSPNSVHTRVAASTDLGATFQYVGEPNQVTPITVTTTDPAVCDASASCAVDGVLWHEVSSIVADPTDPDPHGAFKLFVHSYVSLDSGSNLRRDWGYLGMQTATTLDTWSAEQKLLGWKSTATISSDGAARVLSQIPELQDCLAFTEPGAFVGPQGLDLALDCVFAASATDIRIRVVLLRSTDHAKTFSFVSTLVAAEDFGCLDGTVPQILGADLFVVGNQEYVVVSPIGPVSSGAGGGYRGCMTIPITDIASGTIARSANGAPTVVSRVAASDGRFTGPCTFAEGATSLGQLVPMQFTDQGPPYFRIFRTTIPEP